MAALNNPQASKTGQPSLREHVNMSTLVRACDCNWSLWFLWGSEFEINSTKNRSFCEKAVTGIWGSCRLLRSDGLLTVPARDWFKMYLCYYKLTDGVFCLCCVLFSTSLIREKGKTINHYSLPQLQICEDWFCWTRQSSVPPWFQNKHGRLREDYE